MRACHPGPVLAVTLASGGYAGAIGRSASGITAVVLAVLAGQLTIGWHNDVVDSERDRRAQRMSKPIATGQVSRRLIGSLAVLSGLATVPLSLLSGSHAACVHLLAVGVALSYNAGLKATRLSVLPYAISFSLLPIFASIGAPRSPLPPWWAPVGAALLGSAAHFVNVLPDREQDRALGVMGLPQRLSSRTDLLLAGSLAWAAAAVLMLGTGHFDPLAAIGLLVSSAVLAYGLYAQHTPGSRRGFQSVLVSAVIDVALLLARGRGRS